MKFDIVLMNPPYGETVTGGMYLDMKFVEKVNKFVNTQIVVHPATRYISNTKLGKSNAESGHLKKLYIFDANKEFEISTFWRYGGIYVYDNKLTYETTEVTNEINNYTKDVKLTLEDRQNYYKTVMFDFDIINIIKNKQSLYNKLIESNKTMVNDGHGFIYEENRLGRGKNKYGVKKTDNVKLDKVKTYLKEGTYKYCLYKGSFNNAYDEVQEWKGQDPDKLFKGQICWLTNKENVKNNIKYWMECTLFDLWRRYKFGSANNTPGCQYGNLPALDFEQDETKFREYVDSLNDFTNEEIDILIKNKIHNAENLQKK